MHDQWNPLEADFAHHYQLNLSRVMEEDPRRAIVLAQQLPADSRFHLALAGWEEAWSWERELLATIVELQHYTLRVLLAGFGAKKSRIPKALSLERPYEAARKRRRKQGPKRPATLEEVQQILGPMLSGPGR